MVLVDRVDERYRALMERFEKAPELTIDVETTGLRIWHGDCICGIAVYDGEVAAYFPFRHETGPNLPLERLEDFRRLIRGKTIVNHNIKFDMGAMWVDGFPLPHRVEDSMLAAHLMNENEYKLDALGRPIRRSDGHMATDYTLSNLAKKYLGQADSKDEMEQIMKERGLTKSSLWRLPPELVAPYAVGDVKLAKALRDFYVPHLKLWRLYDLWQEVNRYCIITAKMEIRGLQFDQDRIRQYMEEAEQMIEPALKEIQVLAGYEINPASPKQLQAWLGLDSTSKMALEEELMHLPEDHPKAVAIRKIQEYRGWAKVNSTYYQPYLELCDSNGVIHPNLLLHGTVSGRLSCVQPNLQAVPRYSKVYKVKDVFVARPGYVLVSADYSQAEIRWGTHYAREENMAANLLAGKDIHSAVAEELEIPRDAAKRINFGIIYGIGREALAKQLRIPVEKAAEYLQKYHERYPGFRRLYKRAEEVATERGYIRMFTGRVRRYDQYNPTHKASSNLIQGAVAEMMRLAILWLDKLLGGWDTHMLLQIHDQIIFEVPEDKLFKVLPIIREGMENFLPGFELYVPMKVDIKYGLSWGQMTEWTGEEE